MKLTFPTIAKVQAACVVNLSFITQAELDSAMLWFELRATQLGADGHDVARVWIHKATANSADESFEIEGCILSKKNGANCAQRIGVRYRERSGPNLFISGIVSPLPPKVILFGPSPVPMPLMDF